MGDAVTKKCSFDVAECGQCGKPCDDTERCSKHKGLKCCSCGAPADHDCDHMGQFVCGSPLCASCVGSGGDGRKGLGWGFHGHTHVRKADNASDGRGPGSGSDG